MPFSAIGNMISGLFNYASQQRTNNENAWLAQRQNDWNRQLWLAQTTYNDPVNQVQRLKAAGLNPAIMYGSGIENTAGTPPEMVSSQAVAPSIGSPFASLSRDLLQQELTESQVKLNESAAQRNLADAGLKNTQITLNGIKIGYAGEMNQAQINMWNKTTEKMDAEIKKTFSDIDLNSTIKKLNEIKIDEISYKIRELYPAEVKKLASEIKLNEAQASEIMYLMTYKAMVLASQSNYYNAAAYNQYEQGRVNEANAKLQEYLVSRGYAAEFLDSIALDNDTKQLKLDIGVFENPWAAKGDEDSVGYILNSALSQTFGIFGKLFSLIGKF